MKIELNKNFDELSKNYVFAETAERVSEYKRKNPYKTIYNLGIGDVTLPLSKTVMKALKKAVAEQEKENTFRGYAPYGGYDFMKNAVVNYYKNMNVNVSIDEVFISDGAKSDVGNILDIFGNVNVLLTVPCYPAYIDVNIIKGNRIIYLPTNRESFIPDFKSVEKKPYLIYICSPNNPTGTTYKKEVLTEIVNFAKETQSIIVFDSAYSSFVRDDSPRSIFEIERASECSIEINSLSKSHGFTGLRLGWTVISKNLLVGGKIVKTLWERRLGARYNGVPYIIQRAGEAGLSPEGVKESKKQVDYYLKNAVKLKNALISCGVVNCVGGENAPYVWFKCPYGMDGYKFFDFLLEKAQIVGTVGGGFGKDYSDYFRFSAFSSAENTEKACERLYLLLK